MENAEENLACGDGFGFHVKFVFSKRPKLFSLTNDFVWHLGAQQETC